MVKAYAEYSSESFIKRQKIWTKTLKEAVAKEVIPWKDASFVHWTSEAATRGIL